MRAQLAHSLPSCTQRNSPSIRLQCTKLILRIVWQWKPARHLNKYNNVHAILIKRCPLSTWLHLWSLKRIIWRHHQVTSLQGRYRRHGGHMTSLSTGNASTIFQALTSLPQWGTTTSDVYNYAEVERASSEWRHEQKLADTQLAETVNAVSKLHDRLYNAGR